MADRTSHTDELERQIVADRLNDLADELRAGEQMSVKVGNKKVDLRPTEQLNYRIDVVEKKKLLGGDREKVTIELDWKPK